LKAKARQKPRHLRHLAVAAAPSVGPGLAEAWPRRLRVTNHLVAWPKLARRVRIVQITDVHAGLSTPVRYLRQAISAARQAEPDLVVLTGDFLNRSLTYVERLRRFIKVLPEPRVAVLGNHDHWSDADGVRQALERERVRVLVNENMVLSGEGFELTIVGVDDWTTNHDDIPTAFAGVERSDEALVLSHHPRSAEPIAEHGGRLVLSGHTHGGQIYLPLLTRAISRMGGNRYLAGWYDITPRTRLYVNAGIGSGAVGLRVGRNAIPEVAVFDLVPES
jgi:predicted MPP superfamily phosphohydrolase